MNSSTLQLVRHSFARMLAIAIVVLATVAGALAQVPNTIPAPGQNPGLDVGDQGMSIPHGIVRVPIVTAAGVARFDYWVADTASGFCRIDQTLKDPDEREGRLTCWLADDGATSREG